MSLTEFECSEQIPVWIKGVGFIAALFWEKWLGNSPRLKAASTFDLVVNLFKWTKHRLFKPKENQNGKPS